MPAAVLIALALLSLLAPPAEATFPGRNGDLLVTLHGRSHMDGSQTVLRINPHSGRVTRIPVCQEANLDYYPRPRCWSAGPPAASPDGRSIAIATVDIDETSPNLYREEASIRVLALATGAWTRIQLADPSRAVRTYQPLVRWGPAPGFLLAPEPGGLVFVSPDGSSQTELSHSGSAPDVSSGGWVVFARNGNVQLRKASGAVHRLTAKGGGQPSWSPHGRSVAFTRKGYVYTVPAAGGPPRRLTRGFEPTWSPDGRLIAFFRTAPEREYFGDDVTRLYVLNRHTGRVRKVSSEIMALEGANDSATDGIDWQPAR